MYRELPPPPRLARHIACLWVQTVGPRARVHRVVPDACADVLSIAGGAPFVVGPASGAALVRLPAGAVVVGARFRPGRAPAALGAPADALLDRDVALEDLWGRPVAARLHEALLAEASVEGKIAALAEVVAARLAAPAAIDPLVAAGVAWLARRPGRPVDDLARAVGLGGRQLLRRFQAAVGYGPKRLQRVLRLQRLLVLARPPGKRSLASLAADAGYVDQAHMTREVVALAGLPPRPLLAGDFAPDAMSEFFKTVDAGGA